MINKKLTPFKWCMLQSFPFIEATFDAIDNYGLLCKIVEYVNKNIDKTNELGIKVEELNNWFNNLDVQNEINNKLDEMAEDGTLQEIITEYLNIKGILAFNTVSELKNATNIVDGSFVKTYGKLSLNDGYGEFYKIRKIMNTDVIDDNNLIAITANPSLVAELIKNQTIIDLQNKIEEVENNIYDIKNRHIICIGDSYLTGSTDGQQYATDGWADYIINDYDLTESYQFGDGGSGFTVTGHNGNTFKTLITNNIHQVTNKEKITDIICCGGYNDKNANIEVLNNAIRDFINTCKNNFPNARIYIGCVGDNNEISSQGREIRSSILNVSYYCFHKCTEYGAFYLNGVENSLSINNLLSSDHFHPTPNGYKKLAHDIVQSWITGNVVINSINLIGDSDLNEIITGDINYVNSTLTVTEQIINNNILLALNGQIHLNNNIQMPLNTPIKIAHINLNAIKKVAMSSWYFNESVKVGSSYLPTNSVWYIDENNDLYVIFYELPEGVTEGDKIGFTRSIHTLPVEFI